jgi:hypothetical protein
MLKGRDVELVCGACGAFFARVHVRPLALGMDVRSHVTNGPLMPRPGYSINEEARQRLARAERGADLLELEGAREVATYLRLRGGDIVYDMRCRCGRRYVRTSPDLHRGISGTKGTWLTLSPGMATWAPQQ